MLFDLYDTPKELEFKYWVKRVHFVASVLGYDYFKLWQIPEYEFKILEQLAKDEIKKRKEKLDEIRKNNGQ